MQFTVTTPINASATKVWDVVGNDFNDISEWASIVTTSRANSDLPQGQEGRICEVQGMGPTVETLQNYDDSNQELSFTLESNKMPFFVKKVLSTWSVKDLGNDQAEVSTTGDFTLSQPFAFLMGGMLKGRMSKQTKMIQEELKHFIETGQPKA